MSIVNIIVERPKQLSTQKISRGLTNFYSQYGYTDAYFFYKQQPIVVSKLGIYFLDDPLNWDYFNAPYYICFYVVRECPISQYHFFYNSPYYPAIELIHQPLNNYSSQLVYTDNAAITRTANNSFARIFSIGDQIISPVYENILPNAYGDPSPVMVFDPTNTNTQILKQEFDGKPYPFQNPDNRYGIELNPALQQGLVFNQIIIYPLGFVERVIVRGPTGASTKSQVYYASSYYDISINGNYQYFMIEIPRAFALVPNGARQFEFTLEIKPALTRLSIVFVALKPILGNEKVFGPGIVNPNRGVGFYVERAVTRGRLEFVTMGSGLQAPPIDQLELYNPTLLIPGPLPPPLTPPSAPTLQPYTGTDAPIFFCFGDIGTMGSKELMTDAATYTFPSVYYISESDYRAQLAAKTYSPGKPLWKNFTCSFDSIWDGTQAQSSVYTNTANIVREFAIAWQAKCINEGNNRQTPDLYILHYASTATNFSILDRNKAGYAIDFNLPYIGSHIQPLHFALDLVCEQIKILNKLPRLLFTYFGVVPTLFLNSTTATQAQQEFKLDFAKFQKFFRENFTFSNTKWITSYFRTQPAYPVSSASEQVINVEFASLDPSNTLLNLQDLPGYNASAPPTYGTFYSTQANIVLSRNACKHAASKLIALIPPNYGEPFSKLKDFVLPAGGVTAIAVFIGDRRNFAPSSDGNLQFADPGVYKYALTRVFTMDSNSFYKVSFAPGSTDPSLLGFPRYSAASGAHLNTQASAAQCDRTYNVARYFALEWELAINAGQALPDLYMLHLDAYDARFAPAPFDAAYYYYNQNDPLQGGGAGVKGVYCALAVYIKKLLSLGRTPFLVGVYFDTHISNISERLGFDATRDYLIDYSNFIQMLNRYFILNQPWFFKPLHLPINEPFAVSTARQTTYVTRLFEWKSLNTQENFLINIQDAPGFDSQDTQYYGSIYSQTVPGYFTEATTRWIARTLVQKAISRAGNFPEIKIRQEWQFSARVISEQEASLVFFLGDALHSGVEVSNSTTTPIVRAQDSVHAFMPDDPAFALPSNTISLKSSVQFTSVENKYNLAWDPARPGCPAIRPTMHRYSMMTEIAREWQTYVNNGYLNRRLYIIQICDYALGTTVSNYWPRGTVPYLLTNIFTEPNFSNDPSVNPDDVDNMYYKLRQVTFKVLDFLQTKGVKRVSVLDVFYNDYRATAEAYIIPVMLSPVPGSGSYDLELNYLQSLREAVFDYLSAIFKTPVKRFTFSLFNFTIQFLTDNSDAVHLANLDYSTELNMLCLKTPSFITHILDESFLRSFAPNYQTSEITIPQSPFWVYENNYCYSYDVCRNFAKYWMQLFYSSPLIGFGETVLWQYKVATIDSQLLPAQPIQVTSSTTPTFRVSTTSSQVPLPVNVLLSFGSNEAPPSAQYTYVEDPTSVYYLGRLNWSTVDNKYGPNALGFTNTWQVGDAPCIICIGQTAISGAIASTIVLKSNTSSRYIDSTNWYTTPGDNNTWALPSQINTIQEGFDCKKTNPISIDGCNSNSYSIGTCFADIWHKLKQANDPIQVVKTPVLTIINYNMSNNSWTEINEFAPTQSTNNSVNGKGKYFERFKQALPRIKQELKLNMLLGIFVNASDSISFPHTEYASDEYEKFLAACADFSRQTFNSFKAPLWLPRTVFAPSKSVKIVGLDSSFDYQKWIYKCQVAEQKLATSIYDVRNNPAYVGTSKDAFEFDFSFGVLWNDKFRTLLKEQVYLDMASYFLNRAQAVERSDRLDALSYAVVVGGKVYGSSQLPGLNAERFTVYDLFDMRSFNKDTNWPQKLITWSAGGRRFEYTQAQLKTNTNIWLLDYVYVEWNVHETDAFNGRHLVPAESLNIIGYASCPRDIYDDATPIHNNLAIRIKDFQQYAPHLDSQQALLYYMFNFSKFTGFNQAGLEQPTKLVASVNTLCKQLAQLYAAYDSSANINYRYETLMQDEPFKVVYKILPEGFSSTLYYQIKHIDFIQIEIPFRFDTLARPELINGRIRNAYRLLPKNNNDLFEISATIMAPFTYGTLYMYAPSPNGLEFSIFSSMFKQYRNEYQACFINNYHGVSYSKYLPLETYEMFSVFVQLTSRQQIAQKLSYLSNKCKLFLMLSN